MSTWTPLSGLRVLLADDDPGSRDLLAELLTRAGASVSAYADGEKAVTAWRFFGEVGRPVDAVVIDYDMPGRRGPEVAAFLRASGFTGPVVGVTMTRPPGDHALWIEAGCDAVVRKPEAVRDLVHALAEECFRRRGQGARLQVGRPDESPGHASDAVA